MTMAPQDVTAPTSFDREDRAGTSARLPLPRTQVTTSLRPYRGPARLWGLHKALVSGIGKLPFPGRHAIKALVIWCRDARDPEDKAKRFGALVSTVTVMHGAHGMGAWANAERAGDYGQLFLQNPSLLTGLAAVANGAAAAGFGSAMYAQTDVVMRTGTHLWKYRDETKETGRPVKHRPPADPSKAFAPLVDSAFVMAATTGVGAISAAASAAL